jgi:hypothetical protein
MLRRQPCDESIGEAGALPKMDVQIAGQQIAADESSGIAGCVDPRSAHLPSQLVGVDRLVSRRRP